jgi:WD40 repeat protein
MRRPYDANAAFESDSSQVDDDLIVSSSSDYTVRIWRVNTGENLFTLQQDLPPPGALSLQTQQSLDGNEDGHSALVRALAYDWRRGWLWSASYDRSVIVWKVEVHRPGSRAGTLSEISTSSRSIFQPIAASEPTLTNIVGEHSEVADNGKKATPMSVSLKKLRRFVGHHQHMVLDVKADLTRIFTFVTSVVCFALDCLHKFASIRSSSADHTIALLDFGAGLDIDPSMFCMD